ncbi:hypothetical protein A2382_03415 [Candidatus Woesebacteria bacterium RIFOXYB1_FULL_38_16]|uniref:PABS domain-containing protein n=1 Tax=Candidatus Woesebacteria bacterium RIFOXYB1_FULL_38_16 TaxID=1802538 RepID=A0A1F8CTK7_9BACT|nr:MAG: hypothetical protein A2382_03415 [Candidatus Woesebacteria bacterium RIFOXYB1_FULL_38_16]
MDLLLFFSGRRVLVEVESKLNGKLTVVRDLPWGTYIMGGGLTQSGGVAQKVWKDSLGEVLKRKRGGVKEAVILGLGGGSIAGLIERFWTGAKITGVDIDPVIVDLGKKYLGLRRDVEVILGDAYGFVVKKEKLTRQYDLICIDTYVKDEFPKKFEKEKFLKGVKEILKKDGVVVFNRLYYGEKIKEANEFEKKLEKIFDRVERVYSEANVMFICF